MKPEPRITNESLPSFSLESVALVKAFLPLTQERWVDGERVLKSCEQFLGKSILDKEFDMSFYFLNSISEIIRLFPEGIYPDAETRENLLQATQEAKDILAAKEDAE